MSDNINNSSMLRVGTILKNTYRIERHLSSGGFGNTYMATYLTFNEVVAIKEFFLRGITLRDEESSTISVSNPENRLLFTEQLEKFKKEAQRIRQLHSQHIVRVHDLFEANGTAYYVMDYIEGESLAALLRRTGQSLSETKVLHYLSQIIKALDTIHKAGLYHMDLKPENIMVDKQDNAILIDFGASKRNANEQLTSTVTGVSYTNGYAPPEQIEQDIEHFGPWTDFYALGATLYKLLTNRKPPMLSAIFSDTTADKHNAFPFPETISKHTRRLILKMMAVRWLDRPKSVDELKLVMQLDEDDSQTQILSEPIGLEGASYELNETTKMLNETPSSNEETEKYSRVENESHHTSRKWLYSTIALLLIMLTGGGLFAYNYIKEQKAREHEQFISDSIAQVHKIEQERIDSIEQARKDSIEQVRQLEEERKKETEEMVTAYCNKIEQLEYNNLLYGYFLFDITHDGIPELWVKYGTCEADYQLDVYTYNHGIKRIYQDGAGHTGYCQGNDYVISYFLLQGYTRMSRLTYKANNGKINTELIYSGGPSDDYIEPQEPYFKMYKSDNKAPIYSILNNL